MIVRILGEGQFDVPASCEEELEALDQKLFSAVEAGDAQRCSEALAAVIGEVRSSCKPLASEEIRPSDLVLPDSDASLDEVREMLQGQGLLAGEAHDSTPAGEHG